MILVFSKRSGLVLKKKFFSFNLFNIMILVSISLILSFCLILTIINNHVANLGQDTVKYYSILIKESLDKNLAFSKKIDQREDKLLFYASKMISEDLSDIKSEDLTLELLNTIKEKYDLDGISILKNSDSYSTIEISTTPEEVGDTTEDWGYWNDAIIELFKNHKVESIKKGFSKDNVWVGPKTYSYVDLYKYNQKNFYKYAYVYNANQGYIINTYVKEDRYSFNDNNLDSVLSEFESETDFVKNIFVIDIKKFMEYKKNKSSGIKDNDPYVVYGFDNYDSFESLDKSLEFPYNVESDKLYPFIIDDIKYDVVFSPVGEDMYVVSILTSSFLKKSLESTLKLIFFIFILTFFVILYISKRHKSMTDQIINEESSLRIKSDSIAYIDELTQLPNRHKFNLDIEKIICEQTPSTIFYMDFDGFKYINDNFGHDAGDYVIKKITSLISAILSKDMNIYRIGGDEFIVLGNHLTQSQSEALAKNINSIATTSLNYDGSSFSLLGMSIGIVNFPEHAETKAELLKNADKSMYYAKIKGENSFKFYNS